MSGKNSDVEHAMAVFGGGVSLTYHSFGPATFHARPSNTLLDEPRAQLAPPVPAARPAAPPPPRVEPPRAEQQRAEPGRPAQRREPVMSEPIRPAQAAPSPLYPLLAAAMPTAAAPVGSPTAPTYMAPVPPPPARPMPRPAPSPAPATRMAPVPATARPESEDALADRRSVSDMFRILSDRAGATPQPVADKQPSGQILFRNI